MAFIQPMLLLDQKFQVAGFKEFKIINIPPTKKYGIKEEVRSSSFKEFIAEQIKKSGYAVIDSGYSSEELISISKIFNQIQSQYLKKYGRKFLTNINEINTLRAPLFFHNKFIKIATNKFVLEVINYIINGKFILNQQNGLFNPPNILKYEQAAWHRDLPYQHFVSSRPIAINALFVLDEFTLENGATYVIPGSHREEKFPSREYVEKNATQIKAKSGQFILMDCMCYHSAGSNFTDKARRAINHVYTIPLFKQQIKLTEVLRNFKLTKAEKELFGFSFEEPISIKNYLNTRIR